MHLYEINENNTYDLYHILLTPIKNRHNKAELKNLIIKVPKKAKIIITEANEKPEPKSCGFV